MDKKTIIIIGAGHLAFRIKKHFESKNNTLIHSTFNEINAIQDSILLLENLVTFFANIPIQNVAMVYLVEDKDENNLQLIIALLSTYKNLPIAASLFNENLIPHLQKDNKNLKILNPARIAAPAFVASIVNDINFNKAKFKIKQNAHLLLKKPFTIIQKLLLFFFLMLILATCFFHFYEGLSWINAAYFVVVTAASVGYGDISLAQSSTLSKLIDILLIFTSTISIWMIFSLTIDMMLKKRIQLELGRKKYNIKNHVIVCGLGRLGYFIVEELLNKNEKVIILELNEHATHIDYFRQKGAEIYIGDGRQPKVLNDLNIDSAKGFIAVINNDALNIEIGLNAKSINPNIDVVLRIFDEAMATKIKDYLHFKTTLSVSAIVDESFYKLVN